MRGQSKRGRVMGKQERWIFPSSPWFRVIGVDPGLRTVDDKLSDTERVKLIRKGMLRDVSCQFLKYGSSFGLEEDAVNNLFVRITEKKPLARWNPKKGTRRHYYIGIVRMIVRETLREAGVLRFESLVFEPLDYRITSPDVAAEQTDLFERVRGIVDDLSDLRREAIWKKYSSAIRVEYPKPPEEERRRRYANRSRGLDEVRARVRKM